MRIQVEEQLTLPIQFLGPTLNGWKESRLSEAKRSAPSHRSGANVSGSAKFLLERLFEYCDTCTPVPSGM
jgi:hypothetical protein